MPQMAMAAVAAMARASLAGLAGPAVLAAPAGSTLARTVVAVAVAEAAKAV